MRTRLWWAIAALAAVWTAAVAWICFDNLFAPFSNGGRRVEIPNFCGASYESVVPAEWMSLEVAYCYDDAPIGTVLSQTPSAGSIRKLTDGAAPITVSLTVSRGRETLSVPDLVGNDVREAEGLLRELGFAVRIAREESLHTEGRVLKVTPNAGTPVTRGREILLTVSAGVQNDVTTVPDLHGLAREDALVRLWLARLSVGDVLEPPVGEGNVVIRQSHQPGTRVKASTKITIYLGDASPLPTE